MPRASTKSHATNGGPRLPAKLAPRRHADALPRQRLHAWLDGAAARPLVWIQGPAGSGKTTLVTSYVEQLGAPTVWYRADEGDLDPATCFACLAQAAAACPGAEPVALPLLTPAVMPELLAFARRFLRLMFAALPPGCVLVFDEMEAAAGDALPTLLQVACAELPQGLRILATSRLAPPAPLAHLHAKGAMQTLAWDQLRLEPAEAKAIAAIRAPAALAHVDELLAVCDGWAAGYVVLLEAAPKGVAATRRVIDEQVFPYFVNESFERTSRATRELLLATAELESFTAADAAALCGATPRQLDVLSRESGFVERSAGDPVYYRYHPLFRDFLLRASRRLMVDEKRSALRLQAAEMLRAQGRLEQALDLFAGAGAWAETVALVCDLAPTWLKQGRYVTLERALSRLPDGADRDWPWLQYWRGMARMPFAPQDARVDFEAAYAAFEAGGDAVGRTLACSAVVEAALYQWGDLHHLDRWGDILRKLLMHERPELPPEVAARALGSVSALMTRGHRHRDLAAWALQRLMQMLPSMEQPAARFAAATQALLLLKYEHRWSDACRLWAQVQAWPASEDVPPLLLINAHMSAAAVQLWHGDFDDSQRSLATAIALAQAEQIRVMDVATSALSLLLALQVGDTTRAAEWRGRARSALRPGRLIDAANLEWLDAMLALAQGRPAEAVESARRSCDINERAGSATFAAHSRIVLAMAQVASGDVEGALATAASVHDYASSAAIAPMRHTALLVQAWAERRAGRDDRALPPLRAALAIGREHGLRVVSPWAPVTMLQDLASLALVHGIERDSVSEMLRLRHIAPPRDAPPEWPWPLRVRCLGGFEVTVGDTALRTGPKAPKKPLDLLKAIVVLGPEAVPLAGLIDHLWPDLDGDAAHNAFNVTLHRLRKLLGDERLIVVREARVSLDAQRAWTDVQALRRCTEAVDAGGGGDAAEVAARLLAVYRGPLLADDPAPWVLPCREQLRSRALRACARLADQLERDGRHEAAIELHRRVVEIDPLAEVNHRGLMRCLLAMGRRAEAVDAYRHCVEALGLHGGAAPSALTREVARDLMA